MKLNFHKYQITDKLLIGLIWLLFVVVIAFSKEPAALSPDSLEYPHLHFSEIIYSVNRGLLAIFILYYLLPRYFNKRRYVLFSVFSFLSFVVLFFLEDKVFRVFFWGYDEQHDAWSSVFYLDAGIILVLMFVVKLAWEYREKTQQRLAAIEKEKIESELKFLRSQINPHTLFNVLNNIYSHTLTNTGAAPQLLLQLSDLLRYTIYECGDETIEVEKEIQALRNYVELQKAGLENRADVTLDVSGNFSGKSIPPHILITLVENCFKHSQDTQDKGINIQIDIQAQENSIRMITRNSFYPDQKNEPQAIRENGVGIANVRRRLELLFEGEFELETEQKADVFILELKLPVNGQLQPPEG